MEAFPSHRLLCIGAPADTFARLETELAKIDGHTLELCADLATAAPLVQSTEYSAVLLYFAADTPPQDALNRALQQLAPLPVILLHDSAGREQGAELLARGASDWLSAEDLDSAVLERSLRLAIEGAQGSRALRRAEQESEELRRELQELQEFQRNVAIFAHEINSPLTGLLGFLQLIVEEVEEQEEDPDRAAMLRDSLEAATRIRRVMVKLHQITEPVYRKARFSPRGLLELSQHGESIA